MFRPNHVFKIQTQILFRPNGFAQFWFIFFFRFNSVLNGLNSIVITSQYHRRLRLFLFFSVPNSKGSFETIKVAKEERNHEFYTNATSFHLLQRFCSFVSEEEAPHLPRLSSGDRLTIHNHMGFRV